MRYRLKLSRLPPANLTTKVVDVLSPSIAAASLRRSGTEFGQDEFLICYQTIEKGIVLIIIIIILCNNFFFPPPPCQLFIVAETELELFLLH